MIFDARTLAQLRKTQEEHMAHECIIEPYIVAEDGTISYGTAFRTICGFDLRSGSESQGETYDTITAVGELRLPAGTKIGMNDRVTIVRAFDKVLTTPRVFQVVSLPDGFGPSGQLATLTEIYS